MKRLAVILLLMANLLSYAVEGEFQVRQLKNGITVYLKAIDNDDNTVSFQITSKRGYDSFGGEMRTALLLAPDVVTESGVSLLDGDGLSSLLYDYSIELYYSVDDHYSFILAETFPDSSAKLLELLQSFLMLPKWNREALNKVKAIAQKQLAADEKDPFNILHREHYRLNNIAIRPISEKEVLDVKLEEVQSAFELLFGDPRELSLIATGSFKEEEIMQMVENTLEKIPVPEQKRAVRFIKPVSFPQNNPKMILPIKQESDSAVLLTFALPKTPDAKTLNSLEILAESIEFALKNEISTSLFFPSSIEAAIEFPYYPETAGGWLTLVARFKSNASKNPAAQLIQLLEAIKRRGFTQSEISAAYQQLSSEDQFWQNEDEFWISFLGNCFLMGFDPKEVMKFRADRTKLTPKEISQLFNEFNLQIYTELIQ